MKKATEAKWSPIKRPLSEDDKKKNEEFKRMKIQSAKNAAAATKAHLDATHARAKPPQEEEAPKYKVEPKVRSDAVKRALQFLQDRPPEYAELARIQELLTRGLNDGDVDKALSAWERYRVLEGGPDQITHAARVLIDAGEESEVLDVLKLKAFSIILYFDKLRKLKIDDAGAPTDSRDFERQDIQARYRILKSLGQRDGEVCVWLLGMNFSAVSHFPLKEWTELLRGFCTDPEDELRCRQLIGMCNAIRNAVVPYAAIGERATEKKDGEKPEQAPDKKPRGAPPKSTLLPFEMSWWKPNIKALEWCIFLKKICKYSGYTESAIFHWREDDKTGWYDAKSMMVDRSKFEAFTKKNKKKRRPIGIK